MALLQTLVDGLLQLDPETQERLQSLSGKLVAVELREWDYTFYLAIEEEGLRLLQQAPDAPPDTTLRTTLAGLAQLGLGGNNDPLFLGEVEIRGDMVLGERLRTIFADLELDWEELLAHWTGDVVAHRIGNSARSLWSWGKQGLDSLLLDSGEFLQEERRAVPSRPELEAFLADVDDLRADADRLVARVTRLQQLLAVGASTDIQG